MLHDAIWGAIAKPEETLCGVCVQQRCRKRLGRELSITDLTSCQFNCWPFPRLNRDCWFMELAEPAPADSDVVAWLREHPYPIDPREQAAHARACVARFPGVTPGQYAGFAALSCGSSTGGHMSTMLAAVDNSDGNDDGVLCCPRCFQHDGSRGNLHEVGVVVYDRDEDAALTKVTAVRAGVAGLPSATCGNPSRRRDGLAIEFECEQCGDGLCLTITQHKGDTLVAWQVRPASRSSRAQEG
jgi:hypothetical protein